MTNTSECENCKALRAQLEIMQRERDAALNEIGLRDQLIEDEQQERDALRDRLAGYAGTLKRIALDHNDGHPLTGETAALYQHWAKAALDAQEEK